ncbi:MAG: hypothetical protein Q7S11_00550 [bacterium]|nr:hypothetical protein [bacterium]
MAKKKDDSLRSNISDISNRVVLILGQTWDLSEEQIHLLFNTSSSNNEEVKHRLTLLFDIRAKLDGIFHNIEVEKQWLREKQKILNGAMPLDFILSGDMVNLQRVLGLVEYMDGR